MPIDPEIPNPAMEEKPRVSTLRPALGQEWVVEAHGCDPGSLADLSTLRSLFARMVDELSLHEVETPVWHQFPGPGGITGLSLLAESHLTVHTSMVT